MEIYVDGCSNKFGSAFCIVKIKSKSEKKVCILEKTTPIKIEYQAMFHALLDLEEGNNVVFTDNKQIFLELNGLKEPSPFSIKFYNQCMDLLEFLPSTKIKKVKRDNNPAGIYLENRLKTLKICQEKINDPHSIPRKKNRKKYIRFY